MKIKIYAPLFISVGLALASTGSHAKPAYSSDKKHSGTPSKRIKLGTHKSTNDESVFRNKGLDSAKLDTESLASTGLNRSGTSLPPYPIIDSKNIRPGFSGGFRENRIHSVIDSHKQNGFSERLPSFESPLHFNSTHGIIETSFTRAGHKAGLSDALIEELTKIFAWDIDFASSLSPGDQFTVIYKDARGDHRNSGQIIAAEFMTQGKIFTAVRFKDRNGIANYYNPEGKTMQKAFLSAPVDFARISSHFDSHRRHPVLNRIRAHKGVDYAARTGTPVKSAGDGIVSFRGRKGGYGQVLIIKHGEHYETVYAHLSGFKKGLENGETVKQGEIIGYVGQTGLATGPHLHYEFRIDGVHKNPEALNLDHSMQLNPNLMAEFKTQTRPLLAQLYRAKASNLLAKNSENKN
ncbi:MAG: peptidoglycan DD-metalloendopeptidase family protein [Gammaproteobacteria bacterium]